MNENREQGTGNWEQYLEKEVSGCPALWPKFLPSGFDGVEPLVRTDYESIISDLFYKCNEAFIHAPQQREARPMYFNTVVGDIADALASVVPCDFRGRDVPVASDKDGASADDATRTSRPRDPSDYWKVAEGVQLTRYNGTNVTRLIAVRKGKETNPDVIFEIFINATTKKATIKRDDTVLFTIGTDGLSARRVQTVAISALRSYLRENARQHRHGKERIHRRVAERLAAKNKD